jgi:hypothetical protein
MFERVCDSRWAKSALVDAGLVVFAEDIGGEGFGGIKTQLSRARCRGMKGRRHPVCGDTRPPVTSSATYHQPAHSVSPLMHDKYFKTRQSYELFSHTGGCIVQKFISYVRGVMIVTRTCTQRN